MMPTPKLSNVNNPPRMRSALLPDGMVLRMAEGLLCPCGRPLKNYPDPLPKGFRLICDACHQDVLCYEPQQ
jgi:hypothetical protein